MPCLAEAQTALRNIFLALDAITFSCRASHRNPDLLNISFLYKNWL